jgi:hypothetical protein
VSRGGRRRQCRIDGTAVQTAAVDTITCIHNRLVAGLTPGQIRFEWMQAAVKNQRARSPEKAEQSAEAAALRARVDAMDMVDAAPTPLRRGFDAR